VTQERLEAAIQVAAARVRVASYQAPRAAPDYRLAAVVWLVAPGASAAQR